MTSTPQRRLAGIPDPVPAEQASVYHAAAREAALDEFARAYERELPAPTGSDGPEYIVVPSSNDELLVIAGVWPAVSQTCGRLVAPRELLGLLLQNLQTTAVWCDEDDGEGIAITGHAIVAAGQPMLLAVARSARVSGDDKAVSQLSYGEERAPEGEWTMDALGDFLEKHDGDAVVLHSSILAELEAIVAEIEAHEERMKPANLVLPGPDGLT